MNLFSKSGTLALMLVLAGTRAGWGQGKTTASFSGMKLDASSLAAGQSVLVTGTLHNDSAQDWPGGAYEVVVVVAKGKHGLRKTPAISLRKPIPAGGSKDLHLKVSVPKSASGEISFHVILMSQGNAVARAESLPATIAADEAAPQAAAEKPKKHAAAAAAAAPEYVPAKASRGKSDPYKKVDEQMDQLQADP